MWRIALANSAAVTGAFKILWSTSETVRVTESRSLRCMTALGGEARPAGLAGSPISDPQCSRKRRDTS